MKELLDLFKEFDTDMLPISDFGIQYRGARVDNLCLNEDGTISIWGGNPQTDKHAEEFLPTREEKKLIFEQVLENM